MNKATRKVKIINYNDFYGYGLLGMIGMATESNKVGNIMFYPNSGYPYCICLPNNYVEDID